MIAHSRVAFSWCFSPLVFVITLQSGSRPRELSLCQTVPSKEVVKCFLWVDCPCVKTQLFLLYYIKRWRMMELIICKKLSPWIREATYSSKYGSNWLLLYCAMPQIGQFCRIHLKKKKSLHKPTTKRLSGTKPCCETPVFAFQTQDAGRAQNSVFGSFFLGYSSAVTVAEPVLASGLVLLNCVVIFIPVQRSGNSVGSQPHIKGKKKSFLLK